MKKIILSIVSFFIILSLPLALTHAQEPEGAPQASPSPTIQYKLPYPGILPDHPLYKLKMLRDKVQLFLIADPEKKARQYLHLTNKQLLMSKFLVDKGNIPLARETALKGENQMTLMTFVYKNANRTPSVSFLKEIRLATLKHQEILNEMIGKVSKEEAETFSTVLEFSQRNADQLQYLATYTP